MIEGKLGKKIPLDFLTRCVFRQTNVQNNTSEVKDLDR